MWLWAPGRRPWCVWVSLSGSGQDWVHSRAQCPAVTWKSDGSEGTQMSLVLGISLFFCLSQGGCYLCQLCKSDLVSVGGLV